MTTTEETSNYPLQDSHNYPVCLDCKHSFGTATGAVLCRSPNRPTEKLRASNLVYGTSPDKLYLTARTARNDLNYCRFSGRWFEQRLTFFQKLEQRFLK